MALFKRIVLTSLLFTSTYIRVFPQSSEVATHKVNLYLEGTALLGIATGDVALQIDGVTEAGASLDNVSENSDTRLRISSLAETGVSRIVSAKMSTTLSGTELTVQALPPVSTNFTGDAGTYAERVKLTTSDNVIISNIGTCWSGIEENDGYVIKYTYRLKEFAQGENISIDAQTQVTVTFTLSDAN